MKAVVLAAGKGMRLRPLTDIAAKPMMSVTNRPVMEHIIQNLRESGFNTIYSNLYYRPQDMLGYFGDGSAWGVSILWRTQKYLTGPAGGVALFADCLADEDAILVVSGDALHNIDLRSLVAFHQQQNALLTVAMRQVPNARRYGVGSIDTDKRIIAFEEKPSMAPEVEGLVSCGIYCLAPSLIERIPKDTPYDFGENLIPLLAMQKEAVFCFETQAYWRDIGSIPELRQANLDAITGRVKVSLPNTHKEDNIYIEGGVQIDSNVEIVPPVLIGRNTVIKKRARIIGPVVLGASAVIGEQAYVSNSVILQGVHVLKGSIVVDGFIGQQPLLSNR